MSYFFDGSGGLVVNGAASIRGNPTPANLIVSYPFAMSCWCYPTNNSALQDLVTLANAGANQIYWSNLDGTQANDPFRATTWNGASATNAVSTATTIFNGWNYVVVRFISNTERGVSVNGSGFPSNLTNSAQTSQLINRIGIGIAPDGNGRGFFGYIAHVAVWNGEVSTTNMTPADVAKLARGASPLAVRRQNLVAYWPMDREGAIENVADAKSRGPRLINTSVGVRYSNWNPGGKTVLQTAKILRLPTEIISTSNAPVLYHQRQQQGMAS